MKRSANRLGVFLLSCGAGLTANADAEDAAQAIRSGGDGHLAKPLDIHKLAEMLNAKVEGAKIANFTNSEGTTFDNYYTILLAPVDFNDYLG